MAHSAGERIGHYEIIAPLGKGGMGEVYRARDAQLNREVAIKVLPAHLANDAGYRARFQREARTLAALQHPNIATIHGLEQNAIVMELVEGKTLRGPLPANEALRVARQIAEALEVAHDHGIVHRDLKPANVILTPEGLVKVLDFGLAKAVDPLPEIAENSPTVTKGATEPGVIVGTPAYMSPEQAAGQAVDRRTDIWSFGVVLHELFTGHRLFAGKTASHTLANVLNSEIDFAPIPPGPMRELIGRCLDRNPRSRLQHIGEARIAIENHLAHSEGPAASLARPHGGDRWPWVVAAAASAVAAVSIWAAWRPAERPPEPLAKFEVNMPEGSRYAAFAARGGSAISPDGRALAYVATNVKGETLLHVRRLDSLEAFALAGTEDAIRPFWSPDGKTLGFGAEGKLKRIEVAGGAPLTLCDARQLRGGTWNEDGVIVFGQQSMALQRIAAAGGAPSPLTRLNPEGRELVHQYPQFLPGGKAFLYLVRTADRDKSGIYIGSLDTKPAIRIVQAEHKAVYDAAARQLLYMQSNGTLLGQRLELDPPRLIGKPVVVVAEQVGLVSQIGFADLSVSFNGTLLYGRGVQSRFGWRDRAGKLLETIGGPVSNVGNFVLSPDESRVAYAIEGRQQQAGVDVWVLELARGTHTRVTFGGALRPVWSPDGKQIYYFNPESVNATGIYRKRADGSGEEERLWTLAAPQDVSPDGGHLLFGTGDIMALPLIGERKPEPYLQTKFNESNAAFSPDGRWVAYDSDESGRREVYVQGFPERRGKLLVSSSGGFSPEWRADGRELYWVAPDNTLMAASMERQAAEARAGKPEPLFRLSALGVPTYQPALGGRRFLVLELDGGHQASRPLVLIQNWTAGIGNESSR